jgi:thiol-disulfide isomerase/thioredoxin
MKNLTNQLSRSGGAAIALIGSFLLASSAFAGDPAPISWTVTNHLGKEVHSSSLTGKVTIVNFWATDCLPCLIEVSDLHDVAKNHDKNVAVVGVAVDAKSNALLAAYVDKFKMNYTVAMSNPEIMRSFHIGDTVPMTFVLDQQGRIVRKHVGYVGKGELEKDIRSILKM